MDISNNFNFIERNSSSIDIVSEKTAEFIDSLKISTTESLTLAKILKINSEINKIIKTQKELVDELSKIPDSEKTGVILAVIIDVINSDIVKSKLTINQKEQIENFCNDTEVIEIVVSMIDWVADKTLELMDENKDGIVTENEVENICFDCCLCKDRCGQNDDGCKCYQSTGCCKCCPNFTKSFSSCFARVFLGFFCCKSDNKGITYNNNPATSMDASISGKN